MSRLSHHPNPSVARSGAHTGLLSGLYEQAIGSQGAAYYTPIFARFDALGPNSPSWNHSAAFFTLGWCALRGLWRWASWYLGAWLAVLALWGWVLQGRVSVGVQAAFMLLAVAALCAVPGLLGNRWYYQKVHQQALEALEQSDTLAQASATLAAHAVSPKYVQIIAASYAAALLFLGSLGLWWWSLPARAPTPAPATATAAAVEQPELALPIPISEPAPTPTPEPTVVPEPEIATLLPAPSTVPQVAQQQPSSPPLPASSADESQATIVATDAPTHLQVGRFYIHVGAYGSDARADPIEQQVRSMGYHVLRDSGRNSKGHWVRLRVGPFNSQDEADAALQALKRQKLSGNLFQYRP